MSEAPFSVRRLEAHEAVHLVTLVHRVYGDAYPDPVAYKAEALAERLASAFQRSVGAWSGSRLIGHMAMWAHRRPSKTVDAGWTMVDPEFRGARVGESLASTLNEEMRRAELVGFLHYPVTVNTVTQRLGLETGGVACGFLLSHVSAAATLCSARHPTTRRSDALVLYQPLAPSARRRVYIPPQDRGMIGEMAARASLERELFTTRAAPTTAASRVERLVDDARELVTYEVETIGRDLPEVCRVVRPLCHVDLPANRPETPWATAELEGKGFSFAAFLPEFAEGDVLRLQRLDESLGDPEPARLVSEECRRLHEEIRRRATKR